MCTLLLYSWSCASYMRLYNQIQWIDLRQGTTVTRMQQLASAIWVDFWKTTVGKSQTNVNTVITQPLGQAVWRLIWRRKKFIREKPNICNQCDYASTDAETLRRHLKTHSGERSNNCSQCDFASSRVAYLKTSQECKTALMSQNKLSFWSLSFYPFVVLSLPFCLFVFSYLCHVVFFSHCLFVFLSFCLFVFLSFWLFVFLSFCSFVV